MSNLLKPVTKHDSLELSQHYPLLLTMTVPFMLFTLLICIFIFRVKFITKVDSKSSIPYYSPLTFLTTLIYGLRYVKDLHKLAQFTMRKFNHDGWRTSILGKDVVVLNNGPMIQKLLSSGDIGHLQRPGFLYHKLLPGSVFPSGLLTSEVSVWKPHRAIISKAFTYEYLKSYIKGFNEDAQKLVMNLDSEKLDEVGSNADSLSSLLHIQTLQMISRVVMGSDILSHSESRTFHENFERYKELVSYRYQNVWLFLDTIWNLHPYGKEVNHVVDKLETCIKMNLKRTQRLKYDFKSEDAEETEEKSVLDVMIRAGLREEEISAEVLSLILAGHETVSMSLNFLMFNLALNPEYQNKCREEVDNIFNRKTKNKEAGLAHRILTMEDLSDLKYLERCIKENMRMFPLLPGMTRQLSTPLYLDENLKLDSGAIVIIFPWLLHRNQEYPNPEKFDPDRFLTENCRNRNSYTYQPFSSGSRNCVGWKMALCEMKIISAFILRHFEIHTSDCMEDIKIQYKITISPSKTLNIKLKRR